MSVANSFNVSPSQMTGEPGELLLATGTPGVESTTTNIVATGDEQPLSDATTEYTPVAFVNAGLIEGFCKVELKPFGPVQLYDDPVVDVAIRLSVLPEHIGELLPTTGNVGVGLITTTVVAEEWQMPSEAVTV